MPQLSAERNLPEALCAARINGLMIEWRGLSLRWPRLFCDPLRDIRRATDPATQRDYRTHSRHSWALFPNSSLTTHCLRPTTTEYEINRIGYEVLTAKICNSSQLHKQPNTSSPAYASSEKLPLLGRFSGSIAGAGGTSADEESKPVEDCLGSKEVAGA